MSSPGQPSGPTIGTTQPRKLNALPDRIKGLFRVRYIKTLHFILRVIIIILAIGGTISVSIVFSTLGASQYYNFVTVSGIIVAVIQIFLHLVQITRKLTKIPWNFVEFCIDVLFAIMICIAAAIVTSLAQTYANGQSYAAGGFFGFALLVVYIIDALFRLIAVVRGQRHPNSNTAAATTVP